MRWESGLYLPFQQSQLPNQSCDYHWKSLYFKAHLKNFKAGFEEILGVIQGEAREFVSYITTCMDSMLVVFDLTEPAQHPKAQSPC